MGDRFDIEARLEPVFYFDAMSTTWSNFNAMQRPMAVAIYIGLLGLLLALSFFAYLDDR